MTSLGTGSTVSKFVSLRRLRSMAGYLLLVVAVAAASITVGLELTPLQTVSALGQTVQVGAAHPSFSLSGPAELDLFGQQFPTEAHFAGPVRPRLVLSRISVDRQIANLFIPSPGRTNQTQALGSQLADGFTRYFVWEAVVVGAAALVLLGAVAGWRRSSRRSTITLLLVGFVVVEALNLGGSFTRSTAHRTS